MDEIKKEEKLEEIMKNPKCFSNALYINGFITNVIDATDYNIDLLMDYKLHKKYKNVHKDRYKYKIIPYNALVKANMEFIDQIEEFNGITYRCRLRGVGVNKNSLNMKYKKNNYMTVLVRKLIDMNNGYVICVLSDIDTYKRLLVDIYIKFKDEYINLKNFILETAIKDDNPFFYKYQRKQ